MTATAHYLIDRARASAWVLVPLAVLGASALIMTFVIRSS